ncbi:MAG: serine protein kinase RIO [Promethearchaeota archaeon]
MSDKEIDDLIKKKVDDRRERIKDAADLITHDGTVDLRTRKVIFDLMNRGTIRDFQGIISTGKEANVYTGEHRDGREIAIKVYRINSQTSKWMMAYIHGDPRFATFRKHNTRSLITTWAMKEFKNLQRAVVAGLRCPVPIKVKENVLVMEFIGKGGTPARRLTETEIDDPERHLDAVINGIRHLFNRANLIHGDLSPFNLLYYDGDVYFIDFAQGVLKDHPNARIYLDRDIDNVLDFFSPVLPDDFDRSTVYRSIVDNTPFHLE